MSFGSLRHQVLPDPHGSASTKQEGPGADANLTSLEQLDLTALQLRWHDVYGTKAPARLGAEFLRRAIAFAVQEQMMGGVSRATSLRLKSLERKSAAGTNSSPRSNTMSRVKPGTRFLREWQGEVHEVQAIDTGAYVYRGKSYRSLSVIAREITGTHQSGPKFFGLNDRRKKPKASRGNDG